MDHVNPDLADLGVLELLEQDDRLCFMIDLRSPLRSPPIYYNPRLTKNKGLRDRLHGLPTLYDVKAAQNNNPDWTFLCWQRSRLTGHGMTVPYGHHSWVATTIRRRWRLVATVLTAVTFSTSDQLRLSPAPLELSGENVLKATLLKASLLDTKPDSQPPSPIRSDFLLAPGDTQPTSPTQSIEQSPPLAHPISDSRQAPKYDRFISSQWTPQHKPLAPYDWTVPGCKVEISDYIEWFRNFDWSSTPVGPIEDWPPTLRRSVLELHVDPRPCALYYGKDRVVMYNELYKEVVGSKHPSIVGVPFVDAWPELGDTFEPNLERGERGLATRLDDDCFNIERSTFLEECFFSGAIYPLTTDKYNEVCIYNPVYETTRTVRAEKRSAFLLDLGNTVGTARSRAEFWHQLLSGLDRAVSEVPVAAVYSAENEIEHDDPHSSPSSSPYPRSWKFEGSVGFPTNFKHMSPLITEDVWSDIPKFVEHIKSAVPVLLQVLDGSLNVSTLQGVTTRTFGEPVTSAVLIPITSNSILQGFLFLGLDPRRPYDDEHNKFVQLLMAQLTANMASAVLIEDEIRRGRAAAELAALDKLALSEKLALRTFEAQESEHRFQKMADTAPVALFHFAPNGLPIYCNDLWYDMTEHPRGAEYPMSWYNVIHEEDHELMDVEWAKLSAGQAVHFELRLKKPFSFFDTISGETITGPSWILAAAYSEQLQDGTVVGVLGCLTDISRIKWAEDFQTRRMNEALETKRQQENFIDMTSHEIRNPLSVIYQCADFIGTSLHELEGAGKHVTVPVDLINSHLEAAQTIVMCAQHQKRVIDDVLTLSKLDSNLLVVAPVNVQPATLIKSSLKMFDGELQKADIRFDFKIEDSYKSLNVDWVKLDPSRILQVIINLLTNAIKFTKPANHRAINVSLAAYHSRPSELSQTLGIQWLPRHSSQADLTEANGDWGTGEEVYVEVRVQDTGKGLDEHERTLLFQRFSQASPKTHVQYGGSGLGLFISRQLTELQGGQIGLQSIPQVGSTFAFYVKARRTTPQGDTPNTNDFLSAITPADIADLTITSPTTVRRPATKEKAARLKISSECAHVLVVEDNLVNQKVLSKQLTAAGCIVTVANHGEEALLIIKESIFARESVRRQPLSVVLMDLEMPVMDGLTCVKEIRRLEREGVLQSHVPVIAVTANARSEQIRDCIAAGMNSCVTKPFKIGELIPEMERLVLKLKTPPGSSEH